MYKTIYKVEQYFNVDTFWANPYRRALASSFYSLGYNLSFEIIYYTILDDFVLNSKGGITAR